VLGGGGGASVSASSSASAGPQSGETGNLVLNFGGINLGNQDIPLTNTSSEANNQPATVGQTPLSALSGISNASSYTPLLLIGALAIGLYFLVKK
jgi:hypothetical protein